MIHLFLFLEQSWDYANKLHVMKLKFVTIFPLMKVILYKLGRCAGVVILITVVIVVAIAVIGALSSMTLNNQVGNGLGNKHLNNEFGIKPDERKHDK